MYLDKIRIYLSKYNTWIRLCLPFCLLFLFHISSHQKTTSTRSLNENTHNHILDGLDVSTGWTIMAIVWLHSAYKILCQWWDPILLRTRIDFCKLFRKLGACRYLLSKKVLKFNFTHEQSNNANNTMYSYYVFFFQEYCFF